MPSTEQIDVVIPIIAKDLQTLPLCLNGIRHCVANQVKDIYIVAPAQQEILTFCQANNIVFVDENTVFGYSPMSLNVIADDGRNRSGWLFQQFVKLSGKIGSCRYYLCIDADHVLIRPHVFLTEKNETVFYLSYEENQFYYDMIHRILPGQEILNLSYVDHKMLFDKEQVAQLQETICKNCGVDSWQQAILDNLDLSTISGFSEFETYGNFVGNKVLRPWLQKRLPYSKMKDYDTLRKKYSGSRWSLTFPDYMRQNQKHNKQS
ncbi:MAG: DUF6492 family protein [Prevotella sp.]|nr:DUF6492 family protein [Prevotella sp.]